MSSESSNESNPAQAIQMGPPRKKPRRVKKWKRIKAQIERNKGKEFTDRSGKVHAPRKLKELVDHNVNCRYECQKNISEEKRKEIFEDFWKVGEYNLQTSFIYNAITVADPVRKNDNGVRVRNVSAEFRLCGHRVCKYFFYQNT